MKRLPNSLCPIGNNPFRTPGYKWSLLKVRKGKYKKKHGEAQVKARSPESVFPFFKCF
jgi:hypothetical protein